MTSDRSSGDSPNTSGGSELSLEYPDRDAALIAYAEATETPPSSASDAILNENLLESALARPHNVAVYEDADLTRQAASLFWAMISNHPFRDGNKRTAVVLLYAFLRANDHDLTLTDDELFELAIGVAERRLTEGQADATIRAALTTQPTQ